MFDISSLRKEDMEESLPIEIDSRGGKAYRMRSFYNEIFSTLYDFILVSLLIFIFERGILPKQLRPLNDIRWLFFGLFIMWILWLFLGRLASTIKEFCIVHPKNLGKAIVLSVVREKQHKYCKFKNTTWLTIKGLKGRYRYVGEFNFDFEHHSFRISYLSHSHLICRLIECTDEKINSQ